MNTWQSLLATLMVSTGAAFIPTLNVPTETKVALGSVAAATLTAINQINSNTDPKGRKLKRTSQDIYVTKFEGGK